jgi:hypothetical protein
MLTAVQFYDQFLLRGDKINNVPANRMLDAEMDVADAMLQQQPPQLALGGGQVMAQFA